MVFLKKRVSVIFLFNCFVKNQILLSGTYKPRIRCYDTYQLSQKFERCLDSEG